MPRRAEPGESVSVYAAACLRAWRPDRWACIIYRSLGMYARNARASRRRAGGRADRQKTLETVAASRDTMRSPSLPRLMLEFVPFRSDATNPHDTPRDIFATDNNNNNNNNNKEEGKRKICQHWERIPLRPSRSKP